MGEVRDNGALTMYRSKSLCVADDGWNYRYYRNTNTTEEKKSGSFRAVEVQVSKLVETAMKQPLLGEQHGVLCVETLE